MVIWLASISIVNVDMYDFYMTFRYHTFFLCNRFSYCVLDCEVLMVIRISGRKESLLFMVRSVGTTSDGGEGDVMVTQHKLTLILCTHVIPLMSLLVLRTDIIPHHCVCTSQLSHRRWRRVRRLYIGRGISNS